MKPEVVYKMDSAITGGKVKKNIYFYTFKNWDIDSLKTDANIWQHKLARDNRKSNNSSSLLFLSVHTWLPRVILLLSPSPFLHPKEKEEISQRFV